MDLLTELGVKDAGVFEPGAVADMEKAGARAIIAWAEADAVASGGDRGAHRHPGDRGAARNGSVSSGLPPRAAGEGARSPRWDQSSPERRALRGDDRGQRIGPRVREHLRAHRERLAEESKRRNSLLRQFGIRSIWTILKK